MKEEIIKSIVAMLEKIENENVLREIKAVVNGIYKYYILGKWGR